MKLENQVVSLKLAKKLKKLGVKQESLFWYVADIEKALKENYDFLVGERCRCIPSVMEMDVYDENKKVIPDIKLIYNEKGGIILTPEAYPAFTVAELGEMLPRYNYYWCYSFFGNNPGGKWSCVYEFAQDRTVKHQTFAGTEADARAKMLVYLLENKLIN